MKSSRVSAIAIAIALLSATVAFAQPDPAAATRPPAPKLLSPEIHPDKTVTFRFYAPKSQEVGRRRTWDEQGVFDAGGVHGRPLVIERA